MSKKIRNILILSVITVSLAITGVLIWFLSPGVHSLFGFTRIDVSLAGGLYTFYENEPISEAALTAKGIATPISGDVAAFFVEVSGLPAVDGDGKNTGAYDLPEIMGYLPVDITKHKLDEKGYITADVRYIIFIDQETHEIHYCNIDVFQGDDQYEQYTFYPAESPLHPDNRDGS